MTGSGKIAEFKTETETYRGEEGERGDCLFPYPKVTTRRAQSKEKKKNERKDSEVEETPQRVPQQQEERKRDSGVGKG